MDREEKEELFFNLVMRHLNDFFLCAQPSAIILSDDIWLNEYRYNTMYRGYSIHYEYKAALRIDYKS